MANHSILTENILHGFHGACDNQERYEEAEVMYFRWLDLKESPLAAEAKTLNWIFVSSFMHKIYPFAQNNYEDQGLKVSKSLHEFFRKRYEVYSRSVL